MNLPGTGWSPWRPYMHRNTAASQLRLAAVLNDNAGHAMREVEFSSWLTRNPGKAREALAWMRYAMAVARG